jgi:hypothetical protein
LAAFPVFLGKRQMANGKKENQLQASNCKLQAIHPCAVIGQRNWGQTVLI